MSFKRSLGVVTVLALSIGVGAAAAVSGPGANDNSKLVYTEAIDRATSNLTISFTEGGQKRFPTVDYELAGRAETTRISSEGQIVAQQSFPSIAITGLLPDAGGRVTGAAALAVNVAPDICGCGSSFRIDYTDLVLRNVFSGRQYRLADVSLSTP